MNNQPPDFKAAAQNLERVLRRRLPILIGNTAVNHFLDSFQNEAWEGQAWEQRKPNPFERDKSKRNLLIKTTTLKRSIRRAESNERLVRVATNVPYAEIHNEGGTIVQTPTFKQRMFFSHASDAFFAQKNREQGNKFAAMSTAKRLVIKIPKRQFMGDSPSLYRKLDGVVEKEFFTQIEAVLFNKK